MNQHLLAETEAVRNYIEYPEVEIITYNICKCSCCCKVAYFPIQKLTFFGHWRKSLLIPMIVGFFYILTLISFYFETYNTFPNITILIISYTVTTFFFLSFLFGYICIIIKGPGYVPYSWLKTHQRSYTWEESMKNIAIYNDQVKLAQSSLDRPKRSFFSKDARRFVLRADHFCQMAKSWIGLKNYRYYLLTCLYCFLFSLSLCGFRYWLYSGIYEYYKQQKNNDSNVLLNSNSNYLSNYLQNDDLNHETASVKHKNNPSNKLASQKKIKFHILYIIGIFTTFIIICFGFISLFFFCRSLFNLYRNITILELINKKPIGIYNRGCMKNFEEVCGSKKYICFWPFPFVFCIEPIESGFYDDLLDINEQSHISDSHYSKIQSIESLY